MIDSQLRELSLRVDSMAAELRRLGNLIAGGRTAREAIARSQREIYIRDRQPEIMGCLKAFIASYPDDRLTLEVMLSRLRAAWADEARLLFIGILERNRSHIGTTDLGGILLKHPTTLHKQKERFIYRFENDSEFVELYDKVETAWLSKMQSHG
jgi:hypothetical protein